MNYRAVLNSTFSTVRQHGEMDMLILTRRVGETLMIGDEVTVTVLGQEPHQGFKAV